jgi:hypothetical protein
MEWLIEQDGVLRPASKLEMAILRKQEIEENPPKCTITKGEETEQCVER